MIYTLYTGSYTKFMSDTSIRFYQFDSKDASFAPLCESSGSSNASFLYADGARLLAVNEKKENGCLDLYAIRPDSLKPLDRLFVDGADLCHIHHWKNTDFYSAANYSSGDFVIFSVKNDRFRLIQQVRHHGIGFDCAGRQEGPHVHSTLLSPDGELLYVADLGLDTVFAYKTHTDGTVSALPGYHLPLPAGQGPRHMAFSPDGASFFVVTELGSRLHMFRSTDGKPMQPVCDVSILPEGFSGENLAADLHVSPDGRFVCASNRGADTIAVYHIAASGTGAPHSAPGTGSPLSCVGQFDVHGSGPRNFCLTRDGAWLFAACQYTGSLSVFRRDLASGALEFVRSDLPIPGCVFVGEL